MVILILYNERTSRIKRRRPLLNIVEYICHGIRVGLILFGLNLGASVLRRADLCRLTIQIFFFTSLNPPHLYIREPFLNNNEAYRM